MNMRQGAPIGMYTKIQMGIRRHGWVITGDAENKIMYTVGLTGKGLPELLLRGVGYDLARAVLNAMAQQALDRGRLQPATDYTIKGILGILRIIDIPWNSPTSPIRGSAILAICPRSDLQLQEIRHHQIFTTQEPS